MKIQDLSPPVAVPEPAWKQQLVEFWQQADDMRKIDLEVTLKMGDTAGAQRIIESWQQAVIERRKKKSQVAKPTKSRVRYGYGGYWTPGFNFGGTELGGPSGGDGGGESVREASTPDGVSATTKLFVEQDTVSTADVIRDFVNYCVDSLEIAQAPQLQLRRDPAWSERNRSFGRFDPSTNRLDVSTANRHVMDVLRTVAHELVHYHQQQQQDLPADAGETGSDYENEANARAGELMRGYGRAHPELFDSDSVSESSGYIPTAAEKNDPRFKMALSPDVRPGATGKNANRLGLKTGAQGEPTLLIKGLKNALREFKESSGSSLAEDQDLFEIKMSDRNLKKLVQGIDARAGMEFEMIVPGVSADEEDEFESEPDYDYDESVISIADAEQFFSNRDHNSRRDVEEMVDEMTNDFEEWRQEQMDEKWSSEGQDFLRDWIFNNGLFDRDDHMEQAQNYVRALYGDDPVDEESKEFLDGVTERLDDMGDEFAAAAWSNQDNDYDKAFEEFTVEHEDDYEDSDWLRSQGHRAMSDIEQSYTINWPHWTTPDDIESAPDLKNTALDFMRGIGADTVAAGQYHGSGGGYDKWTGERWVNVGRNKPQDCYTVETDGSLEGDEDNETGLEFVSPPLPLAQLLADTEKIRAWAKSRGAYTNDSTGLHMNVSVPDTSTAKMDYIKLALLLGDERVLSEFGRSANTYARSALGKIRDILKKKPEAVQQVMAKMREHMEALATKVVHSGETEKYTSINTKGNYVEFRGPGGDYLGDNWSLVAPTLMRTVVALDAAMDPGKYRQEYQKKLYKLLDSSQERLASPNVNKLLSLYFTDNSENGSREVAVQLAKELLTKREMSRKELERQQELLKQVGGRPGQKFWWNVQVPDRDPVNVVGADEADALEQASAMANRSVAYVRTNGTVNIVKPYVPTADTVANGAWGVSLSGSSRFERQPNNPDEPMTWATKEDAETWIDNRVMNNPGGYSTYVAREVSAGALTGAWGIWAAALQKFVTSDGEIRRFDSAEDVQAWIESYQQSGAGLVRLEPREIESQETAVDASSQGNTRTFRAFDVGNGNTVGTFQAAGAKNSQEANVAFSQYIQSLGRGNTAGFDYDEAEPDAVQFQEPSSDRGDLTPRGSPPWGLYNRNTGGLIRAIDSTLRANAEQEARRALGFRAENPEDYEVKSRAEPPAAATPAAQQPYEIFDRPSGAALEQFQAADGLAAVQFLRDYQSQGPHRLSPAEAGQQFGVRHSRGGTAPRTLTTPAQPQQTFSGEWKIVDADGQEIHRFGGVGNVQADANATAIRWLQQNPRHMQAGVEVVPVMSE